MKFLILFSSGFGLGTIVDMFFISPIVSATGLPYWIYAGIMIAVMAVSVLVAATALRTLQQSGGPDA